MLPWPYVVFALPILLAMVLGAGSISGLFGDADVDADIDVDLDIDIDVDVDADADADAESEAHGPNPALSFLTLFGFGKAPLSVLLSAFLLGFGVIGFALFPFAGQWMALAGASVGAPLFTALVGRFFARFLPSSETYVVGRADMIGCVGTVQVRVDDGFGVAGVIDGRGDLHAVRCRADVTIPSGAEVVVVDFDERSGLYDVAPCDVELRSPRAAS